MTALLDAMVAVWLAAAVLGTIAIRHYWRAVRGPTTPGFTAPAVVIIPVRGAKGLPRLLPALVAQDFPDWRLIFSLEAESDPAFAVLSRFVAEPRERPETELVIAGIARDSSQKLHNQLAALARLRARDEIVVFADADIVPRPDWLARLVHPLGSDTVQVVSGWRWLAPADDRLATAFVCAAHASFSLAPRTRGWALAWGGSMALRRSYRGNRSASVVARRGSGRSAPDPRDLGAWWRRARPVGAAAAVAGELRLARGRRLYPPPVSVHPHSYAGLLGRWPPRR